MRAPDPGRIAESGAWLTKAAQDLRGAGIDRNADPPFLEDVLFHSQQAVEKTLKAFLCWNDTPFRKTYNLIELGEACAKFDVSLEPLLRKAAVLTEYAWKFRYPGDVGEVTTAEADEAMVLANKVFEEIKRRLPGKAHPTAHEAPAAYSASRFALRATQDRSLKPRRKNRTHGKKGRKRKK